MDKGTSSSSAPTRRERAHGLQQTFTRREYLLSEAMLSTARHGWVGISLAQEAVSSVALEHPEWDMDEVRTLAEWRDG